MIGNIKYKFKVGQRLPPSAEGIEALIFPKPRYSQRGIVKKSRSIYLHNRTFGRAQNRFQLSS